MLELSISFLSLKETFILGSLTDAHVWDCAKLITSEEQLQSLGTRILELPEYEVRSLMHSKKYTLEAREILERWRKGQPTPQDVYNNLTAALNSAGWSQLANDLAKWAPEGEKDLVFFFEFIQSMSGCCQIV